MSDELGTDSTHWMGQHRALTNGAACEEYDGAHVTLVDTFAGGRLQAQLDRIEHLLTPIDLPEMQIGFVNRWGAFSDDEIRSLSNAIGGDIWGTHLGLIEPELKAEMQRREAADADA